MSDYDLEAVDRLPFATEEKAQRYRTDDYRGAVGLNWYLTDPTLQSTTAYYLQPDELAVVQPHLTRIGELMGGPVARWARKPTRTRRGCSATTAGDTTSARSSCLRRSLSPSAPSWMPSKHCAPTREPRR